MNAILRYYVERREGFRHNNAHLLSVLRDELGLLSVTACRMFYRYDIEGITESAADQAANGILAEAQTDLLYKEDLPRLAPPTFTLAVESLPGQYDQRADSCEQSIEVVAGVRPRVRTATVYLFWGELSADDQAQIVSYLINPVEMQEATLSKPDSLAMDIPTPEDPPVITGFIDMDRSALEAFCSDVGLAMDLDDLAFMQSYFKEEQRDPTETELHVIDTYWSDHCRHTTFHTHLTDISIADPRVQAAFERYQAVRADVYGERLATRAMSLMDIGTLSTKYLKKHALVRHLDESEEINACSVHMTVETDLGDEPWLYMFKNETHNHPTEIEPFGGAATCLGGAIRDPLSGRSYVYQGLRLTGAANPFKPLQETLAGKLPQRRICTLAADGFSSYGNQIGLATGLVDELYHPGYEAKRMEVGAVLGAAPLANVVRETPAPGDYIVLLGGRTGRDGCGGATGSSKTHSEESLTTAGAEVQKGNPVTERKIQRFFRRADISRRIKRCNDFGAGGVSVAIGELADGLDINLDLVPKKYEGLNGTELAISESQERMACVIDPSDWEAFHTAALEENLEATVVATVTEQARLHMRYRDKTIVDISRAFLDTAGADRAMAVEVQSVVPAPVASSVAFVLALKALVADMNIASKRGMVEKFDASIGASTVLMPYGGRYQRTPIQAMAAKVPVLQGQTDTTSLFTYGFDPELSDQDPYQGAYEAVVESMAKLIAAGMKTHDVYLSLQEYFPKLGQDPAKWGRPFAALLGAFQAQLDLQVPAIGGKDSMSGTFETLEVPATLISFATTISDAARVISPEFKEAGHPVYLWDMPRTEEKQIDGEAYRAQWQVLTDAIADGTIVAAWAVTRGGIMEGLAKMSFGNGIGVQIDASVDLQTLFAKRYGAIVFESTRSLSGYQQIATTNDTATLAYGADSITIAELVAQWEDTFESLYPTKPDMQATGTVEIPLASKAAPYIAKQAVAKPKAVIPVFPGTNCEYDTKRQVELAGGTAETVVIANLTPDLLRDSVARLQRALSDAQMLVLPGGFSFGDEPDGSGKFIAAFLRNPALTESIHNLLYEQDGLMLGICNGFQALIKLGLLPGGRITDMTPTSPTLTFNDIARHQSRYVTTKVITNHSPWLMNVSPGECYSISISHGEGKFYADETTMKQLIDAGQVAFQYADPSGTPSMDIEYNPNGSTYAIEGLISPDGRILGKMGHSERIGSYVAKNITGNKDQGIFRSAMHYFSAK